MRHIGVRRSAVAALPGGITLLHRRSAPASLLRARCLATSAAPLQAAQLDPASHRINPPRAAPDDSGAPIGWGKFVLVALGLTALYGLAEYAWAKSGRRERLQQRLLYPLDVLEKLREAREWNERGMDEKEVVARKLRRAREAARKKQQQQEEAAATLPAKDSSPAPLSPSSPLVQFNAEATLSGLVPSLLEAERQYRELLTGRLQWKALDLHALHALVEEGTATPSMRSVGRDVDPAQRHALQQQINEMLDPSRSGADGRVVPYVISKLAYNLHMQAEVLRDHEELERLHSQEPDFVAAPAELPPPPASVYRLLAESKFRAAEDAYLQSLTLYQHNQRSDPRPYAVQLLSHLGSLYYAWPGQKSEARKAWLKGLEMVTAANKEATKSSGNKESDGKQEGDAQTTEAIGPPPSYARCASELHEKLAAWHRARGEYEASVSWLRGALEEWDHYASAVRAAPQSRSLSGAPPPSPYARALHSLPNAAHLLTALSADLWQQGSRDEAYAACVQSLQVLERIVQLEQMELHGKTEPASQAESSAFAAPHARFLSDDYFDQLTRFVQSSHPTSTPLQSVRDEAAASFWNLAHILRDSDKQDAQISMRRAKEIMRMGVLKRN